MIDVRSSPPPDPLRSVAWLASVIVFVVALEVTVANWWRSQR